MVEISFLCHQNPALTLSGLCDTFIWIHSLYLLFLWLPRPAGLFNYCPAVSSMRFTQMCALRVSFKYYHRFDLLWTLQLSTQFLSCAPAPCVTDWWSWTLIMTIIINMQTYHSCLYWVDFASPQRTRGLPQNLRSRALHLRTSVKTSERRRVAAAARSFWRCCCGSAFASELTHTLLCASGQKHSEVNSSHSELRPRPVHGTTWETRERVQAPTR